MEVSSLNGTNGFAINGIKSGYYTGYSVASAWNINDDGIDDIVISSMAGQEYAVFGEVSDSSLTDF
ncbi:MAG: integrin alpha [Candidatus Midichloria sp.]|nr:integrin alpha [Candidatus Midichloria sp.]